MFLAAVALPLALSAQTVAEPAPYRLIRLENYLPPILEDDRAGGEQAGAFVQAGAEAGLPSAPPAVEMTARGDMSGVSVSIAFNWVRQDVGGQSRSVWLARLRAAKFGWSIERFADARQCPGVEQSLAQLNDLPVIDPRVPAPPDPTQPYTSDLGGYLHDNRYQVRLRGLFAGAAYTDRLEVTGGSSAPFARIIAETLERLLPCWTETPPPRS